MNGSRVLLYSTKTKNFEFIQQRMLKINYQRFNQKLTKKMTNNTGCVGHAIPNLSQRCPQSRSTRGK